MWKDSEEDAAASWNLITSASDLLKVCEDVHAILSDSSLGARNPELVERLNAAIAKTK